MISRFHFAKNVPTVVVLSAGLVVSLTSSSYAQSSSAATNAPKSVANVGQVDLDGDGEREQLIKNPRLPATESYGLYLDEDLDVDQILIGTKDGARIIAVRDADADPKEQEVIIQDDNLDEGTSLGRDLDGDSDFDLIVVGPQGDTWEMGIGADVPMTGDTTTASSTAPIIGQGMARYNATPLSYRNTMAHYDPRPTTYQNTMAHYTPVPAVSQPAPLLRQPMRPLSAVVGGAPVAIRGTLQAVVKPQQAPVARHNRF